jgi:hypothetical protein
MDNPYYEFKKWIYDNKKNSELDENVIKAINPLTILGMFLSNTDVTIYLNEMFNKFESYKYNKKEMFDYIKNIISNNKLSFRDSTFVSIKNGKVTKKQKEKDNFSEDLEIKSLKEYERVLLHKLLQNTDTKIKDSEFVGKVSKVRKSKTK